MIETFAMSFGAYQGSLLSIAGTVLAMAGATWVWWRLSGYGTIEQRLAEFSQRQEQQNAQITCLPQLIDARMLQSNEQSCLNELRRLLGDVFAVAFQIRAVQQAHAQHPEIDGRIVGQFQERGIGLVSRIWLFIERDDRVAQELVALLRHWLLEPKAEQYVEWERRAYQLSHDVIRAQRSGVAGKLAPTGVNFADTGQP